MQSNRVASFSHVSTCISQINPADCSAVSCAPAMFSHDTTDVMSFGAVALLSLSRQCPCASHAGAAFIATFNCNALWALFYVMTLSINDPLPYLCRLCTCCSTYTRIHRTTRRITPPSLALTFYVVVTVHVRTLSYALTLAISCLHSSIAKLLRQFTRAPRATCSVGHRHSRHHLLLRPSYWLRISLGQASDRYPAPTRVPSPRSSTLDTSLSFSASCCC